jgi:hypothetical protein
MYERYEAQYHWYELTQLVQKTIFVLVMIFLLTDPVLQVSTVLAHNQAPPRPTHEVQLEQTSGVQS